MITINGLETTAKFIIALGLALLCIGAFFLIGSKLGLSSFKLPGDIIIKRGNFTFYFPWVTSIVLSILLSVILGIIARR